MGGLRPVGRTPRSSSISTALPPAPGDSDHIQRRDATEQLALEIEVPAPRLVVTVDEGVVPIETSAHPIQTPLEQVAHLGETLALVLEFHESFDLPREPIPTTQVSDALAQLRVRLLREEVEEYADASEKRDLVAIADALADVVYVAYGSAVTYGIDLDAVVHEVHRSNMSKLDHNGRPLLREDGKVLKSDRYRPPNIGVVIQGQLPLFHPDRPVGSLRLTMNSTDAVS